MDNRFHAFESSTRAMCPLRPLSKLLIDPTSTQIFARRRLVFSTKNLLLDVRFLKGTMLTEDFWNIHASLRLWVSDFLLQGISISSLVSQPRKAFQSH
jgi:hypothetical protein